MIIPITTAPKDTGKPAFHPHVARLGDSLFLIEMQGKLEVDGPREGGFVGTLGMDDSDKVTLRIGVHHLQGKIASLPKPLGILTKRKLANSSTEYEITEIVTKKIIFSKRPTPIVGHAGPVLNQS